MAWHLAWFRVRYVGLALIGLGVAVSPAAVDAPSDFDRYQVILDRRPFGGPSNRANRNTPARPPLPELPPFTRQLELCFIGEGPTGQRVGFRNTSSGKRYYLYLRQTSEDGITVRRIHYDEEKVLLEKDGREHWLAIVATPLGTGAGATGFGSRAAAETPRNTATRSTLRRATYVQRIRRNRRADHSPELDSEDLRRYLREYQKELVRNGQPPLPMPPPASD